MKRLILMRHAKSNWSDRDQLDIERQLNKRGQRDAPAIGRWLAAKGYLPERALVSSAVRTQETWRGLTESLPACPADFVSALYHASAATMLAALRGAGGSDCVLMLGHQPGIGDCARRLLEAAPDDNTFEVYPTAAVSIIDFVVSDWTEVDWHMGTLADFMVPKALG